MAITERKLWYNQKSGKMHIYVRGFFNAGNSPEIVDEDILAPAADASGIRLSSFFLREGHWQLAVTGVVGAGSWNAGVILKSQFDNIPQTAWTVSPAINPLGALDFLVLANVLNRIPGTTPFQTTLPGGFPDMSLEADARERWSRLAVGMDYARPYIRGRIVTATTIPLIFSYGISLRGYYAA